MGMYTELIFGARLKKLTQLEIDALKWMCGNIEKPKKLHNHEFFECYKSDYLFNFCSCYFLEISKPIFKFFDGDWFLTTRSNLKNYENEIEKFLDWIKPFIDSGSGKNDLYAIVTYEEDLKPTLYFKNTEN